MYNSIRFFSNYWYSTAQHSNVLFKKKKIDGEDKMSSYPVTKIPFETKIADSLT